MGAERLAELEAGRVATRDLVEALAIDLGRLAAAALPGVGAARAAGMSAPGVGYLARMATGAGLAIETLGPGAPEALAGHPSDTVRGWGALAVGRLEGLSLEERLARIRPFADDGHFAVREWAWMAVRPAIAADIPMAIRLLCRWSHDNSVNIRRFTTEVTRPRGVWCAHLRPLVADPAPGLVLLEPLRADGARYVQDSVANWLNDAAKSRPDWVAGVVARWGVESPCAATARIIQRATRGMRRQKG